MIPNFFEADSEVVENFDRLVEGVVVLNLPNLNLVGLIYMHSDQNWIWVVMAVVVDSLAAEVVVLVDFVFGMIQEY